MEARVGVGGVHPWPGETDAAMERVSGSFMSVKLIQNVAVLALADSRLPLPIIVWEPRHSGSNVGPISGLSGTNERTASFAGHLNDCLLKPKWYNGNYHHDKWSIIPPPPPVFGKWREKDSRNISIRNGGEEVDV